MSARNGPRRASYFAPKDSCVTVLTSSPRYRILWVHHFTESENHMNNPNIAQASPEYNAALAANDEAYRIYSNAVALYRARKLDDANFSLAQDAWKIARAEFDIAFEAEANREEKPTATIATPDLQLSLI